MLSLNHKAPLAEISALTFEEFGHLVNDCELAMLFIDEHDRISWYSELCLKAIPELRVEKSACNIDLLKPFLNSSIERAAVDLPVAARGQRLSIRRIDLDGGRYVLKIVSDPDRLAQDYLAEREKLFEKARQISVCEMVTTVSHELNQPLGTVTNVLNGLKQRLSVDHPVTEDILQALKIADEQSQFAVHVLSRMRDYAHSRKPQYKVLELNRFLHEATVLYDWMFSSERVSVETEFYARELMISADETMLTQVIANLFRNALDAMRANAAEKTVSIKTAYDKDTVSVEITDNGHGLRQQSADQLYIPFHTTRADGMGVGLGICRSFIELHQGRLWLTQNDRCGCTAHLQLPVYLHKKVNQLEAT